MNQNVMLRISTAIDNVENIDTLSAKDLAELSYTSQATISRYIKLIGFNNFFEFKMVRKAQRERSQCENTQYSSVWIQKLSEFVTACESEIQTFDNIFNMDDKVYIWCKSEYVNILTNFTNLMAREGYAIIVIDEYFDTNLIATKGASVLTVGHVPASLYNEKVKYTSIVYTNQEDDKYNIEYLKLVPIEYCKYDTLNINFRLTCIQLMFGMVCNRLCLNDKS